MSLAKSVVTGTVYRAPEKRFTQNNVGVSAKFLVPAATLLARKSRTFSIRFIFN